LAAALPCPGSKPHFETIAAILDTTRAVSACTRHNPFEFDDCGISNALYNAIARAHRFEHPTFMNWLDPRCVCFFYRFFCFILIQSSFSPWYRYPLTQRSLPFCKRTYFARGWMLKGGASPLINPPFLLLISPAFFSPSSPNAPDALVPIGSHRSVTSTSCTRS
jgi:hypothetical protein